MITLKINNSYSEISGLSVDQYLELKELLSYTVNAESAYFGGRGRVQRRSLLTKRCEFPTGLLYLVEEYLKDIAHKEEDLRIPPIKLLDAPETLFKPGMAPTPYPEQLEAPEAIVRANGRGIVTAPTGFGKSYLIALTIDRFKVKTLVVVPRLELKRQLTESLMEWFGEDNYNRFVEVANVDSLDHSKPIKGVGMVIVDEFHHSASQTYRYLNKKAWKDVYYRVGFTATPFRANDNERLLLESFLSQVVYSIPYAKAVDQGYIVPLEAYHIEVPKTPLKGNQKSYPAMYSECIVNNHQRNTLIAVTLARLSLQGQFTLCLVKEIRHGEILAELTGIAFANGKDGDNEKLIKSFNQGHITSLIATTGVCGEGVDTKPAEWIIIAGAGKAKTQLMQQVGRGFRTYPGKESCKVVLLKDSSHPWFRKHYREQVNIILDEYNVESIKIEL